MTLRMDQVVRQLPAVVSAYLDRIDEARAGVARSHEVLREWTTDLEGANERIKAAMAESPAPFALADTEWPDAVVDPAPTRKAAVIAVDGSSIEPDRFAPVQCYVVNIGWVVLPYGVEADSDLASRAEMGPVPESERSRATRARTMASLRGVRLRRDVAEMRQAARLGAEHAGRYPTLVLLDGTFLPWDLESPQVPGDLQDEMRRELTMALQELESAASCGEFAAGAYISASNASDVTTSLTALDGGSGIGWQPGDRAVFADLLQHGQRSAVFRATSNREGRAEQRLGMLGETRFFYLRIGGDIARVEMPAWMSEDPDRLAFIHAALVDQCARCDGYPRALQEAHEQAVINGADREQFTRLLAYESGHHRISALSTGKAASKRRRSL